ncbi:hypothetical protein TWF694_006263 [Orbilia ellipsospora]|uniref:Uncharacterized protein n=1 Tax=Orbilia ellipsospora TaxID=2528407 RepID=A0AAV9XJN9_9PEZI
MENLGANFERMSIGSETRNDAVDVDTYFRQHADRLGNRFHYDPTVDLDIKKTFRRLMRTAGWNLPRNVRVLEEEKEKFFEAIAQEFTKKFGRGDQLSSWHRLLLLLGYGEQELPHSITKCKKELARFWINIYDFLRELRRLGLDLNGAALVNLSYLSKSSLQELREYSKSRKLLYPLDLARGTILTGFLVHMF